MNLNAAGAFAILWLRNVTGSLITQQEILALASMIDHGIAAALYSRR
jgi:hypothetical protein